MNRNTSQYLKTTALFLTVVLITGILSGSLWSTKVFASSIQDKTSGAARAFLETIQGNESSVRLVREQSGYLSADGKSAVGVVVADLVGDETPELIYPMIIDEQGEYFITMQTTGNYHGKVVYHIAVYDQLTGAAKDIIHAGTLIFDETGTLITDPVPSRWRLYRDPGTGCLYKVSTLNLSGTAQLAERYEYNALSGALEKTYEESWGGGGPATGEDSSNPVIRAIAANVSDAVVVLTGQGTTDYPNMTYDEAVQYLQQLMQ